MRHPYAHLARELRSNATPAEQRWWRWLRRRPLGFKFRRQVPIGPYILDFACYEARVAIEADGEFHADQPKDLERDAWLHEHGWEVARYWNQVILRDINAVAADIERRLSARRDRDLPAWCPPTPALTGTPARQGRWNEAPATP
jgi:very-short-patch-repair endonuclease